jgi:RNA polymerase sigma-70 factor (ECF subfamily)
MELEEAVTELAPRVLRYCVGRTGGAEVGEEVAQEALVALVRRWRLHGPPESPEAFVFAVARRRAFRAVVRRRLLLPLMALTDGGAEAVQAVWALGVEERAVVRDELAQALAALRRLPSRDREALLLAVAGEMATADAARVLGISPSAFKMRLHRARTRLSELLEDRDGETLRA